MIQHDKSNNPASAEEITEAISSVGDSAAKCALEAIEPAPSNGIAALACVSAAAHLLNKAINLDPTVKPTAQRVCRIALKMEKTE